MLDRKVAPPFVQSTAFDLISPRKEKLPNGTGLFFVPGGSQDVLKIELLFQAGRWHENKWGAAHFASNQLAKGTRHKTSFEIARIFDRYGAHLEMHAGLDVVSIALYSLTKNLQPSLALLHEFLTEPTFPEKELEQAKSIFVQNLKVNEEKTSFLAGKHFRKCLFGADHPYGKELDEHDVSVLRQADLVHHFHTSFKAPTVFISGKIEPANEKLITDTFDLWKTEKASGKDHVLSHATPAQQHITKEGSVQASVRMGAYSILRSHPEYSQAVFVSHILGGYFGSRLMKNIREEKGLTYGIYASIHPLRHASYLVIGADVNKENIALTFDEIRKELKRLRTETIDRDELETARNHFIGSLQSELTTSFAHADKLKTIFLSGLPATYYQDMISSIMNMTAETILEVSEKYFHEKDFFEIAVG